MSDGQHPRPSADAVARACIEMWRPYLGAIPAAWMEERGGAVAVVSGIPGSGFNGVWVERPDASPGVVGELLDRVAAERVPHCLQLRAGAPSELTDLARRRGMTLDGEEPAMVLDDPPAARRVPVPPALTIERLAPGEGAAHARVAAPAFGARLEVFEAAATEAILSVPGILAYVGRVEGKPVTTAVGVTHRGVTGVIAVATLPAHRGRGYAAAVTARAALDGFAAGASWAWLQADPSAVGVYERVGFRTVDRSAIWVCE